MATSGLLPRAPLQPQFDFLTVSTVIMTQLLLLTENKPFLFQEGWGKKRVGCPTWAHSRFHCNINRHSAASPVYQLSSFLPSNKPPWYVTGRKGRKSVPTLSCHVWTAACDILHNRQDHPPPPCRHTHTHTHTHIHTHTHTLPPPSHTVNAGIMKGRLTCI